MFGTHVITALLTFFFALSLQVCSRTLLAQTPPADQRNPAVEPTPTPEEDPSAANKSEVVCGGSMAFVSSQFGATRDSSTGNVFKLKPVAGAGDKRAQTGGVVKLERNHEFAFNLTWIPKASQLVHGEDLLTATVRYQRRDSTGKIKVLAESIITSDQLSSFSELTGRRVDLPLRARFNNPEIATAQANRAGQLPDGTTTTGSFDCYMRVGKQTDF